MSLLRVGLQRCEVGSRTPPRESWEARRGCGTCADTEPQDGRRSFEAAAREGKSADDARKAGSDMKVPSGVMAHANAFDREAVQEMDEEADEDNKPRKRKRNAKERYVS